MRAAGGRWLVTGCGVALAAPVMAWTTPLNVSNQPSGSRAFGPRLGRDAVGHTHVVWAGGVDPSGSWRVWYQGFDGTSWSGATALSGPNATRPDIAVDGAGTLHVVYEEAAEKNILYRRRTLGGGWTAPVNLRSGGRSIAPAIACDSAGSRILVAWHEDYQVGGEWDIFVNTFDGASWSGAYNISSDSAVSTYPRVAVDAQGNMHVGWSSGSDILYRRRDAAGAWGPAITIRHTPTRIGLNSLAVTGGGIVLCLFAEDDTQGWEVYYMFFNGMAWSAPQNVSNHSGDSDDIAASLYVDAYDRLFAVWHDYSGIYYSTAPTHTSAWSAREVLVGGKYLATDPDIVVDAGLTARVAWQSRPAQPDNWNVYVSSQAVGAPGPRGAIAGVVRDQHGYGVAGATVTAGAFQAITGVDGTYVLAHVAAGTYSVSADKASFLGQTVAGVAVIADQTAALDFTMTALPPGPVAYFSVTPTDRMNRLRWQNPADGNFGGTMIRFSTTGWPAGPTEGTLLIDPAGAPGAIGAFDHEGLTIGQVYYYAAFAHDDRPVPTYAAGVNASGRPPGPADFDGDGDVDLSDFSLFQLCFNGPNVPPASVGNCGEPDISGDGDVDLEDFARFQACFNGPNRPPVVGCIP